MKTGEFPRQCLLLTLTVVLSVHVQKSLSSPSPMLVKLAAVKIKAGNELRPAPAPVSVSSFPVLVSAASASGGAESVVPGPKAVGVNRTRIAEVRPYRIQRKLSPPTSSEMFLFNDNNSMERDSDNNTTKRHREKDRKPKRKLLHYIPSALSKTVNNVKLKRTNSKLDRLGSDRLTEKMKAKLKNAMKEFEEDLKLKQLTRQSILMHDDNEEDPYGYLHYPHHSHSHSHSHSNSKDETEIQTKYSNYAIDPAHPAVLAMTQHNPLAPFRPIPPSTDFSHPELLPGPPKKKKRIELPSSLLPLDKTLLYTGMAFSWVFWLIVALSYYSWGDKDNSSYSSNMPWISIERRKSEQQLKMSQKPIIVKLEPGKPAQFFQTR